MAKQQVRPLNICADCKHVKCSCGGCHSRQCADPCGYESAGGGAPMLDADGKVWCGECGGLYLPHSH
jgi:hypothetical protein